MTTKKADDYTCTLSPADIETAKKELNETPDTRLIEVNTLRNRLENVPGLVFRKDTTFLLQFLRARKFDQEKAFQLVKNYYRIRQEHPDVFSDMKPSKNRLHIDNGVYEILQHRNNEGCKVIIFRFRSWDPERHSIMKMIPVLHLFMSTLLEEEETQVHGIHLLVNLEAFTMKQALHITPSFGKVFFSMVQDCLPARVKRLEYVHQPAFWDVMFALFKPFISEKLVSRIFLHGDKFENLHKTMNPDYLPTDFGGRLPLYNNKAWMDAFMASDAKFEEDNKFGFVNMAVNKDKKAIKREDADLAGLGGTFKKLDI